MLQALFCPMAGKTFPHLFQMGCLDEMAPALALQFHSNTICQDCRNLFPPPCTPTSLHEQHASFQCRFATVNKQVTEWIFRICKIPISQVDSVVPFVLKCWTFDGMHLDFPPANLCWWLTSCSFPALNFPWGRLSKYLHGVGSWKGD